MLEVEPRALRKPITKLAIILLALKYQIGMQDVNILKIIVSYDNFFAWS